ncbi:LuxR C-terminal-related transcriptional regulator [Arthrobacter sp. MDT3-24]
MEALMVSGKSQILLKAAFAAGAAQYQLDGADQILHILADGTRHDAAALLFWNPDRAQHIVLANDGYQPETLAALGDPYAATKVHRKLLKLNRPLRIDDLKYDYRETQLYQTALAPAGFTDGMTTCLISDDGQYAGMLHLSATHFHNFDDDARDLIGALSPIVAELCRRQTLGYPILRLREDCKASLLDAEGDARPVISRNMSSVVFQPRFREFVARFLAGNSASVSGLWAVEDGTVALEITRTAAAWSGRGDVALIVETPMELPFGLTTREAEVIDRITVGRSNQQIASELGISIRTVTTHVENILVKMAQESRSGVAAVAIGAGLHRLDTLC